jgi:hypothetical protein
MMGEVMLKQNYINLKTLWSYEMKMLTPSEVSRAGRTGILCCNNNMQDFIKVRILKFKELSMFIVNTFTATVTFWRH